MGGIGVTGCLEWATRNFKVGDTLISNNDIPVSAISFVDGRLFSGGRVESRVEQQVNRIPLSVLNKVATNIDASQLNTYINSGSQSNTGTSTPDNKVSTDVSTDSTKFVWTPIKKVVAGALIIGAIYGILKLTKVI
jgi:hypothetical protein